MLWLVLPLGGLAQNSVFDVSQFESFSDLALAGSTTTVGERLQLTPAETNRSGGVWYLRKRYLGAGFETTFSFRLTGGANGGGEGLAFVIQNNAVPALGPAGPAMGYGGINNSLAVEIDTRQSTATDPAAGHISVQVRGTAASPQTNSADHAASIGVVTAGLPNFTDGNAHTARVVYASSTINVYVDGGANPVLTTPVDLAARVSLDRGQAWFGLTAANGAGAHVCEILSWSVATAPTLVEVDVQTPLDGASFVAPAVVTLTSAANATNASVVRVDYHAGSRKIGEASASPFTFVWEGALPGVHVLTATAFDDQGRTNLSPPVVITVLSEMPPIGINFIPNVSGSSAALSVTNRAGVVPQRQWNNVLVFTNGSAVGQNLKNGLGMSSTIDVSADFVSVVEHPAINPALSDDHRLMLAFGSDQAGAGGVQTNSTITLSQIPFPIYDVIVYSDGNNGIGDRVAQIRNGTNSIFLRDASWANFSGIYAQATGATEAGRNTSAGNYVRFNGVTAASFALNVVARSATDSTPRAAINAIQIIPSVFDASVPPTVTRGPYLQMGTPRSMIVRWRTNRPVNSRVRYGTSPQALDQFIDIPATASEHSITLTNLNPDTRYYYAIGTATTNLVGTTNHFFRTSPTTARPTRIWVLGDAGTAGNGSPARQESVRNAYYNSVGNTYTDLILMLGDNAYNSGTDAEFQAAMFDMYPTILRQTPAWSTVGNHETGQSHTYNPNIPYYRIFDLPRNGEAGGVPSGTEQYYSFDYGNIHFVCLDAMTSSRAANGPMANWLQQDLAANTNHWLIGFWHHPPYTKGSHDSDNPNGADFELVEMRENILPILEAYGVDLVLGGHSHAYERSYLISGHYGYSTTIEPSMFVDQGSGRAEEDASYVKTSTSQTPYQGTVYIVAGSSGQATFATTPDATFATTNHPAMFISMLQLGSLVLDINGNRLDARFLRENGENEDNFTIYKFPPAAEALFEVTAVNLNAGRFSLSWNTTAGRTYFVQRASSLVAPVWQTVSDPIEAKGSTLNWSGAAAPGSSAFYRVVCDGN